MSDSRTLIKSCLILAVVFSLVVSTRIVGLSMNDSESVFSKPIKIESGLITGFAAGENKAVYVFKGIPYAAPPVGDLRWREPQPVEAWEGVQAFTEFGFSCLQPEMPEPYGRDFGEQSEDCLYLNVWTGAKSQDAKLPVMVWIHGGGFYMGSATTDTYDGEVLARDGVVLVTINYRLGPFGFLAHPLLSKESEHKVSGNYGLLDQIAALKWVKNNIASFGGDPDRVTIFGESGGARSVCFLMVSPLAKGLFHRGIVQSGSLYRAIGHLTESRDGLPPMEEEGQRLAKKLGCKTLADFRKKPAIEILEAAEPKTAPLLSPPAPASTSDDNGLTAGPIIDGWVIPDDPVKLYRSGKQHDVPLIIGSNKDEASIFLRMFKSRAGGLARSVKFFFPKHHREVLPLYAEFGDNEFLAALNRFMTDAVWTRAARATARDMAQVKSKVYLYFFTHHRPTSLGQFGSFHGIDIRYAFGHDLEANIPFTEEDHILSKKMRTYWTRFAATGDPNGPDLANWPPYDKDTDQCLELGSEIRVLTHLRKEACDLFDRINEQRRSK